MSELVKRNWRRISSLIVAFAAVIAIAISMAKRDIAAPPSTAVASADRAAPQSRPGLSPDLNPQVRSLRDAREKKQHERLSPLASPTKFDRKAFEKDPHSYLDVIEPGRIGDVLQPSNDAPSIALVGRADPSVAALGTIPLSVTVLPNTPVTFTSFDLGAFENQLNSITVQADDKGLATVQFTATAGTTDTVHIAAGCPLTAGMAHFAVEVEGGH